MPKHLQRVTQTDTDRTTAVVTAEQAIRDAYAAGHTPTEIADALGTKNRSRVYGILGKTPFAAPEGAPSLRPIVHLTSHKRPASYEHIQQALWARGYVVISDHMSAWHMIRGGVPAVQVEVIDATEGPHFGYHWEVQVGQVRARHGTDGHELVWTTMSQYDAPTTRADDGTRVVDGAVVARWVAEYMPTGAR